MGARSTKLPAAQPGGVRKLAKGEHLFVEGEMSRAMYYIKSGILRLYKQKGNSQIELDTVRSGQVLGELAFLDGNPRSASGEALTECELVEISGPQFQEVLAKMPDWLKILLKTVVNRLRSASTRIRQLEQASTQYQFDEKDGRRSAQFVYISPHDFLKIATATLLVASRNGGPSAGTAGGIEIKMNLLNRYANQIMGIPQSKITTFVDLMSQANVMAMKDDGANGIQTVLTDINFLEKVITYFNDENLIDPAKRHDISLRGFMIMSLMVKHLPKYKKDDTTGNVTINFGKIRTDEQEQTEKEPFRIDECQELVKLGYCSALDMKGASEVYTTFNVDTFLVHYRLQRVAKALQATNEGKKANIKKAA